MASTSSHESSRTLASRRVIARGVKATLTSRRSRVGSGGSRATSELLAIISMPSESRGSRSFSSAGVREEEKIVRGLEDLVDVVVARHQPHADLRHLQHRACSRRRA